MGLQFISNRRMLKRAQAGHNGRLPKGDLELLIPIFDEKGYEAVMVTPEDFKVGLSTEPGHSFVEFWYRAPDTILTKNVQTREKITW